MEVNEKLRSDFYLRRLKPNLPKSRKADEDDLPTLDETVTSYAENADLREKIAELSNADAVSRFYAAVLLWSVETGKANEILTNLQNNQTPLTVQKSVGHGAFVCPLYLLARDFLAQKSFYGENFGKVESLANWSAAVVSEKRHDGESFDENTLPRYEDALEAQADAEKLQKLRLEIEKLKNGSVAERFYAAALVQFFDETEARNILEGLRDESAEIGILRGDIMMNLPASQVADELLGQNSSDQNSTEFQSPIARFFKWLGG
jgi:hypothetical protein